MDRFDEIFTEVSYRIGFYVSGTIIIITMVYICIHVFARYVLGMGGVPGTYSYGGTLLVPFIYLALSYGWYRRGYVVVDVITQRLKGRILWISQFTILLVTMVLFTGWLVYGGILTTISSYEIGGLAGETGCYTPEWPWKATIIIGALLMVIRNILDLIRMVRTGEVISDRR